MTAETRGPDRGSTMYVCPSCHLHLLTWIPHTGYVDMFHKVALWTDFWTGQVRLICQYCLGSTDILPDRLVDVLRQRFGLYSPTPSAPPSGPRR